MVIRQVGEIGVTAYGIVNYINNLSYMALFGIGQGIQPVVSYYYGRGKFSKAREQYVYGIKASLVMSVLFLVICLFAGRPLIMIFASSREVIDLSYTILTYLNLAYILLGVNLTTQMYCNPCICPDMPISSASSGGSYSSRSALPCSLTHLATQASGEH